MKNRKFNREVEQWLKNCRENLTWQERAADLLVRMVAVNTTPQSDPAKLAEAEAAVFDIIEDHLKMSGTISELEAVPISTQITEHPYFSIPYYVGEEIATQPPAELVKTVYAGRSNRIARIGSGNKPVLAFNAHIDVVPPYIPPHREGDIVYGRGSCDDKGACVAMILAAEWLDTIRREFGIEPAWQVLLQFVIEEEMGGNGSLSLALDQERSGFDSIVVLECTGLGMHPGNRGAVWYKVTLESEELDASELLEAASSVVGALDRTGKQLKAESDHPLFPTRPVQTCHGRMGSFGQHPSRVHDFVSLLLSSTTGLPENLRNEVDTALQTYCAEYGNKTIAGVGDGLLEEHLRWTEIDPTTVRLELFGLSGHMGATERLDGAITKAAWIIRHLMKIRRKREGKWKTLRFSLEEDPASELILEGGQGFVPTHCLEEVCERMRDALSDGVAGYCQFSDLPSDAIQAKIGFDKLHNDSYARPADGTVFQALRQHGHDAGIPVEEEVSGWNVSCDARIFAREYPGAEVITFGPGALAMAHSSDEQVNVTDIIAAAEALVRLALDRQTAETVHSQNKQEDGSK